MTKWECYLCGQVLQKYSLVADHLDLHKKEEQEGKNK
jgi:hypothetical protein